MKYAIIENSVVVNIALADEPLADNWIPDPDEQAQIKGTWDGIVFQPYVVPPEQIQAANKATAQTLLQATDWATLADITTGSPKLNNQADFLNYRNLVRVIAINPPTTPATFPTLPQEQWTT